MNRRHKAHLLLPVLLAAFAACNSGGALRGDTRVLVRQEETPAAPELRPATGELASLSREMAAAAERVRQLSFLRPIEVVEGSPEVVSWLLRREVDHLLESGELQAEQATLEALGFISHEGDYEALILDLYEEQVRGLYDHKEKVLLVVPSEQAELPVELKSSPEATEAAKAELRLEASLFLLHEIVHALQDQHFGLERFLDEAHTMDQGLAGRALVEGDATYAMYEHFLTGFGRSLSDLPDLDQIIGLFDQALNAGPEHDRLNEAPLFVRETLMFSYVAGLVFVHSLHSLGGWEAVDAAYESPPTTTQQILQFDRYLAGVGPESLLLPSLPMLEEEGYELVAEGRMGELGLRLFLAEHSGTRPGPGSACGWKGDSYAVYDREEGPPAAAWVVSFADEGAAAAFLKETEEEFPDSKPLVVRLLDSDLIGITTHLPQEISNLVLERLAAVERDPAPVLPFRTPSPLTKILPEAASEGSQIPAP